MGPRRPVWPGTSYMTKPREGWYTVSKGVSVFAWEALAKGFMSGSWGDPQNAEKWESHRISGEVDRILSSENDGWRQSNLEDAYLTSMNIQRRERAKLMAEQKGVSLAQVA